jgi:hypothetical protein
MTDRGQPTVPPLIDGGVMLTWRCTNACRHCIYRCSPDRPNAWITPEKAEEVFAALAREPRLHSVHLAGGEATLNVPRLIEVIGIARKHGVRLSYLETNAAWCVSEDLAVARFTEFREAGLPGLLISASPYHNEFIPFARTRNGIAAGRRVFGPGGVLVWTDPMARALSSLDPDRTHTLEEFLDATGLAAEPGSLPSLYPARPGGRAAEALRDHFPKQPAEAFAGDPCARELDSTVHFHVDPDGQLFTGGCPGLVAARSPEFHPPVSERTHPAWLRLHRAGPTALLDEARPLGYRPREDGYVSKCDLCQEVRRFLHGREGWDDLAPSAYYE